MRDEDALLRMRMVPLFVEAELGMLAVDLLVCVCMPRACSLTATNQCEPLKDSVNIS